MSDNLFTVPASSDSPKLLDRARGRLRLKHYSMRTESAHTGWVRRFIRFHGMRHPAELGKGKVEAFLSALAAEPEVSAATQNQALSALLFLYKEVLDIELPWLDNMAVGKFGLRGSIAQRSVSEVEAQAYLNSTLLTFFKSTVCLACHKS